MSNKHLHLVKTDEPEEAILIEHGPWTLAKAKELNALIKSLPLDTETNDKLVSMMVDQLMIGEHEAYIQGFMEGMESIKTGNFSVIADKIVKVSPISFK